MAPAKKRKLGIRKKDPSPPIITGVGLVPRVSLWLRGKRKKIGRYRISQSFELAQKGCGFTSGGEVKKEVKTILEEKH